MFACIYIPDFPVAALVRAEPSLRARALAVLDGKPPQMRVASLNDKARVLGMETGMTKMQASSFAEPDEKGVDSTPSEPKKKTSQIEFSSRRAKAQPKLTTAILRQRSPAQEASSHAALLDVAHAFAPRVEDTHLDRLLLDLDGLERLYGPAVTMARELASRVSAVSLECNIGVATNPDAAMHAACGFSGTTVIPPGEEARRLGVLPLTVLLDSFDIYTAGAGTSAAAREHAKLQEQMFDALEQWGVRDFRRLALLPEHALASRLGEAGARLQRLARGEEMRTLALCEPPMHFEEAMELESAVETIESLSFVLNCLLDQLCARLEARALAVQELKVHLQLERRVADEQTTTVQELAAAGIISPFPEQDNGNIHARTLRLPVAMRDPKVFLKLLQLDLAACPPGAPVCKVWIAAEPARPRSAQRGLFLPVTPEAEKLEITLARIAGVVGERHAGIAKLLDTHHPNAFRMERFISQQEPANGGRSQTLSDTTDIPPIALRILRPAHQLRMHLVDGRPCKLGGLGGNDDREDLQGKILWSAGPWRSSGDWWAEQATAKSTAEEAPAWDREEWDIALANHDGASVALYRIYHDMSTGKWFADASYD